jgi:hypothetical protein
MLGKIPPLSAPLEQLGQLVVPVGLTEPGECSSRVDRAAPAR